MFDFSPLTGVVSAATDPHTLTSANGEVDASAKNLRQVNALVHNHWDKENHGLEGGDFSRNSPQVRSRLEPKKAGQWLVFGGGERRVKSAGVVDAFTGGYAWLSPPCFQLLMLYHSMHTRIITAWNMSDFSSHCNFSYWAAQLRCKWVVSPPWYAGFHPIHWNTCFPRSLGHILIASYVPSSGHSLGVQCVFACSWGLPMLNSSSFPFVLGLSLVPAWSNRITYMYSYCDFIHYSFKFMLWCFLT